MGAADQRIDDTELQRLLQAALSAVLLVEPRILRRVIREDRAAAGIGLQVPHRKSYWLPRERLLQIASREELGVPPGRALPPRVVLLGRPDEWLAAMPRQEVLQRYWRLLLHVRVHWALEARQADGKLDDAAVRRRIERIGMSRFEEIRTVLHQEGLLLPPGDDRSIYIEFAAVYLEARSLARNLLPYYFPAIDDFRRIDAILAEDLDAAHLCQRCRPAGAADPVMQEAEESDLDGQDESAAAAPLAPPPLAPLQEVQRQLLKVRADVAAARGNTVRAALLLARLDPGDGQTLSARAGAELDRLCGRLQPALQLSDDEVTAWRQALAPLLQRAARGGVWPVEARLLYDLQKVCLDHERAIYAVDLVEWVVSWGRIPVKRLLPDQGLVRIVRHLRSAARRLSPARISGREFQRLALLLVHALEHAEQRLRDALRPRIDGVLTQVGMQPSNVPEEIARMKVVEELLDGIVTRGFLTLGDLRDAISRNNLRLPDLSGPREFFGGDRLIRANRGLAAELGGIYRRGEIYLRWLQRFSALAFGTHVGRFLTRYLGLPFGGAYIILEGLQHLAGWIIGKEQAHALHLASLLPVMAVGIFLLALLHLPAFRQRLLRGLGGIGFTLQWLFFGLPVAFCHLAPIRFVLASRPYRWFARYLLRPVGGGVMTAGILSLAGLPERAIWLASVMSFLLAVILFNTRLGRDIEETLTDTALRGWKRIRADLLPGLFRLIMGLFKRLVEDVERGLYSVDEWLRFRSGDSRWALVWKPVLGLVWFVVTYVVRFSINLLIEPQINPIKHFPVVTVSHKLVLPIMATQGTAFFESALGLPPATAGTLAGAIAFVIPGMFGFLAWELKENWRLYRANQAPQLQPVVVGSHGETLPRLLRPGFHSGTLPKLYARLRRALSRGNRASFRKRREELHHVEEALRHFVDREFVSLLHQSRGWGGAPLKLLEVGLASNSIRLHLGSSERESTGFAIVFEEYDGFLAAGCDGAAWMGRLTAAQRAVLATAVAGLYKLCAVHVIRESEEGPSHDFAGVPVLFTSWVEFWQNDRAGQESPPLLDGMRLLPMCEPGL
jgi:hypothetical protein